MTVGLGGEMPHNHEFAVAQLAGDLGRLEREWAPFSSPEAIWHACPGHEWERFDYDHRPNPNVERVERITRCSKCGAARCDTYDPEAANNGWEWMDDHLRQFWRCTLERHHEQDHDFLTGNTVAVGG